MTDKRILKAMFGGYGSSKLMDDGTRQAHRRLSRHSRSLGKMDAEEGKREYRQLFSWRAANYRNILTMALIAQERGDDEAEESCMAQLDDIWRGMTAEEVAETELIAQQVKLELRGSVEGVA